MKKIVIASALLIVTAGCQPGSKSPGSGSQTAPQKEVLHSGIRTSDLGNVPSPDDEIQDSTARQDAMKDLQLKVLKLVARLKMDVLGITASDETSKLLSEFVNRKQGDKNLDIVDALQTGTLSAALEVKDLQGEITDKEMQKVAIQRSVEKVAAAYGFDKEQSKTIVAEVNKREHMISPTDEQIQFVRDLSENIKKKTAALINDFKAGNDQQLCGALAIFVNNFNNVVTFKSRVEFPSIISQRVTATAELAKVVETCKNDVAQARKTLGAELPKALTQVDQTMQLIQLYIDPTTINFAPISLEIMDRWKLAETSEVLASTGSPLTGEIAADGITCQVGNKVFSATVKGSDEESTIAEVDFELAGEKPFKIRKMQGQRGITLVYMSSRTSVLSAGKSTIVNAGEGFVSTVLNLVPGFAPISMTLGTSQAPINVICQSK